MTTLYIDEYTAKGESYSKTRGHTPDTVYPTRVTGQKITTSGSSQKSAMVNTATAFVCIRPVGGAVYIAIGTDPTATANSKYLPDGEPYDVDVDPSDKIAVINA